MFVSKVLSNTIRCLCKWNKGPAILTCAVYFLLSIRIFRHIEIGNSEIFLNISKSYYFSIAYTVNEISTTILIYTVFRAVNSLFDGSSDPRRGCVVGIGFDATCSLVLMDKDGDGRE